MNRRKSRENTGARGRLFSSVPGCSRHAGPQKDRRERRCGPFCSTAPTLMRELVGGDRRAQGLKPAFEMTETLDSDMSAAYNSSNGPADRIPHERQKRRGHTNGGSERPGSL